MAYYYGNNAHDTGIQVEDGKETQMLKVCITLAEYRELCFNVGASNAAVSRLNSQVIEYKQALYDVLNHLDAEGYGFAMDEGMKEQLNALRADVSVIKSPGKAGAES